MKIEERIESIVEFLTGSEGAENCIDEGDIKDAKIELKELKQVLNIHLVSQQRELLKAFLEHIEDTVDFLPCEPNILIDDYFDSF